MCHARHTQKMYVCILDENVNTRPQLIQAQRKKHQREERSSGGLTRCPGHWLAFAIQKSPLIPSIAIIALSIVSIKNQGI
jgi:hypothetical protein